MNYLEKEAKERHDEEWYWQRHRQFLRDDLEWVTKLAKERDRQHDRLGKICPIGLLPWRFGVVGHQVIEMLRHWIVKCPNRDVLLRKEKLVRKINSQLRSVRSLNDLEKLSGIGPVTATKIRNKIAGALPAKSVASRG